MASATVQPLMSPLARTALLALVLAAGAPMTTAAKAVGTMGGGLAVADGEHVLAALPLPVGGIMSDRPIAEVRAALDQS